MSDTAEMETYDWKKNPRGPGVLCPFADRHRGGNFKPCITETKSWTLRGAAILHATRACQANFRFPAMFKFPDADPFRVKENGGLPTDCRKPGVDDSDTEDEDDHGTDPKFVDVDLTARPAQASKPVAATPTSVPATPANDIGTPGSSKRTRQEGPGPSDKRPRAATGVALPGSVNATEAREKRLRKFKLVLEQPHVRSALKALKDLKDLPYLSTRTARMELVASLDKDLEAAIRLTGPRDNKPKTVLDAMDTMSAMRGYLASISKGEDLLYTRPMVNTWMGLVPTATEWNQKLAYLQSVQVFPGVESFFESSLAKWKALHDNLLSEWRKVLNDVIA